MARSSRALGPVVRFGVAQALLDVQFWLPLWLIFLLDRGFSLGQAALADAVFRVTEVVLEVPMGWVCDRIGRRNAYTLLCLLTAATFAGMALVHSMTSLLAVWLLWAMQWATASGLGSALGYDLAAELPADQRRRVFGRIRGASAAGVLVSLASAGALYAVNPMLPFALTAGLALVSGALSLTLPHPAVPHEREGLRAVLGRGEVRWLVVMGSALLLVGWPVQILYQPLALQLGLGPGATSWMFVTMAAAALLGTVVAGRPRGSVHAWQIACAALVLGCCAGIWLLPRSAPVFALLALLSFAYALATTITEFEISRAVGGSHRAAGLSMVSLVAGLFIAAARPGLLVDAGRHGASAAFGLWAVLGLVPLAVMAWAAGRLETRPPGSPRREPGGRASELDGRQPATTT